MYVRSVLVGVALGALLVAPAADAKKKKTKPVPVVVATGTATSTTDDQPIAATANCPAGKIAVGGGFTSERFPATGGLSDLNIIYESRRAGAASWTAAAVREDAGGPGPALTLTASVLCRTPKLKSKGSTKAIAAKKKKKPKKLVITETSATSPPIGVPGALQTATANCPGGQTALSGGFSSAPPPELGGSNSIPVLWQNYANSPSSWVVSATQGGAPVPHTVTSYAYCAKKVSITSVSGTTQVPAPTATSPTGLAATAACPAKRTLVGGGFNHQPVVFPAGPVYFVNQSQAVGAQWTAGGINAGPPQPAQFGAVGYCLK